MLTGTLPFRADTPIGVVMQHINDPPPPPSRFLTSIPAPVDAIILRALDKDPTRRWPSAEAFAQALHARQGKAAEGPSVPTSREAGPATQSSLVLTTLVAALVLGALVFLLWTGFVELPGSGALPTPTMVAPLAPIITGAIDPNDAVSVTVEPEVTSAPEPTATVAPAPTTVSEAAPTIAPLTEQTIAVPSLQGQTMPDATRAVLPLGLRIAFDGTAFSDTVPMNAIIAQDPPAGTSVSPGTTIRVSLSRGRSPFANDSAP
jgi:serine/threonine-protein kinase